MRFYVTVIVNLAITCWVSSQPPPPPPGGGGGGGGVTVSGEQIATGCSPSSGLCALDGASNYVQRDLSYDKKIGKFSGTIKTNQCSQAKYGLHKGESVNAGSHSASCISQIIPAPAYTNGPSAAPLRGRVALSLHGVNVYGPFEAGFSIGQACTNGKGSCDAGIDVSACFSKIALECGDASLKYGMLSDDCGGHAAPYHYHEDLACDYNNTNNNGKVAGTSFASTLAISSNSHSPLIAIALDGYGIYGLWESDGKIPIDLDACGGHYGPVPTTKLGSQNVSIGDTTSLVYHYHTQNRAPFIIGCFGPVTSLSQCKSLYPNTCNSGFVDFLTKDGCAIGYDTDCPCFQHYLPNGSETYNQVVVCNGQLPIKKSNDAAKPTVGVVTLITMIGVMILVLF